LQFFKKIKINLSPPAIDRLVYYQILVKYMKWSLMTR